MIVIDGEIVSQEVMAKLDQETIQSIDVLKDKSATTLWDKKMMINNMKGMRRNFISKRSMNSLNYFKTIKLVFLLYEFKLSYIIFRAKIVSHSVILS